MKKGFTLIELVIVIAVIAILAGVLITTFSGVLKSAEDSVYLQTRKNSQTEDAIDEIFDTKVLSWNTIEEALVYAFVKTGSHAGNIKSEQIITEMYTEISDLINNGYSCHVSETYLKTMYNKTIDNKFSDVQIIRLLKDSETDFDDYYDLMRKLNPINNSFEKLNNVFSNSDISKINEKLTFVCDGFSDEEKNSFISHFSEYIRGNICESANNISINIECDNSINKGEIKPITVTINNYNGVEIPTLKSSNPNVVFVNNNKIVGLSEGTTKITATVMIDNVEYNSSVIINSISIDTPFNVINLDNGNRYTTLKTAIDDVSDNQTLLLCNSISSSEIVEIKGKNFNLIGNDPNNRKSITYSGVVQENYIIKVTNNTSTNTYSNVSIKDITFDGNNNIGILKVNNSSALTINNCIITNGNGTGSDSSGGIRIDNGSLEISDSTVTSNSSNIHGGGIYATNSESLTINNCIISNNSVTNATYNTNPDNANNGGAGIMISYTNSSGNLNYNIINTKFISNNSITYGGGLYCRLIADTAEISLNIIGCEFKNNIAKRGGGCSFVCNHPLSINASLIDTIFDGNNAEYNLENNYYDGGAILDSLAYITISGNSEFKRNSSRNSSVIALRKQYSTSSYDEYTYIKLVKCKIYKTGENSNINTTNNADKVIFVYNPVNNKDYVVDKDNNPVVEGSSDLIFE